MRIPHSRQLSLQNRLIIGMGAMLVPLVALGVGAFIYLESAVKAFEETAAEMDKQIFPLTRLQRLIEKASNPAEEYIFNGDPAERNRFIYLSHLVDKTFADALSAPFAMPQEQALVLLAQNEWQQARTTSEAIFTRPYPVEGESAALEMERLDNQLDEHTDRAVESINAVHNLARREIAEDLVHALVLKRKALLSIAIVFGLGLGTVLVVSIVLTRSILLPLHVLKEGVGHFREGELSHRIVLTTRDELEELAMTFNLMASKLEQSQLALKDLATMDPLTGLPNRILFMDRLEQAVLHAKRRSNYVFAVLFLDLDRFKIVNDSLGHLIGDELLIAIAHRLKVCLRDGDTIARLGGDEFAILLKDIKDVSFAIHTAERINQELTKPFNLSGQEVFTSASIGVVLGSKAHGWLDDLLRNADIAMYRAKALGKARYHVFDTAMHDQAVTRLQMETDLRRAIERQELQVHYQPIVLLETCRITGFEALVRWEHPEFGLISPDEFISVAEESGLLVPIGWWVLHEVCRQMRAWQVQFPTCPLLAISVNLSIRQFTSPELIEQIAGILHETNLDARSLRLEVTESMLFENAESVTAMLSQLKDLGVSLYLDDFGTSYSSLTYLHQFPIDALKIDRSFVSRMNFDEESGEIVRTITLLAHSLGMDVIAEGVETKEQLAQLSALQCKYAQGYFFYKPLDGATAGALIAQKLSSVGDSISQKCCY
jgi:diguanylate cyclase (GGDEF)-like protein